MLKTTVINELLEWIKAIILAVILVVGIRCFLCTPVAVEGSSMMPTFEDGDRVIVNKIGPRLTDYDRFDVIVFKSKENSNYIKRIIGLPGDHIQYKNNELIINGKKVVEPFLEKQLDILTDDFKLEETGESVVPAGHFFVLGDNRQRSTDSRDVHVGFVPEERVLGTADVVFWPIKNIGFVKNSSLQ